ncbi:hypothetical protein ElyMa_002229100 [Elysia marginata]|uniref:ATP synthase F0 subunit 8 n=1 Tax=Elysia marginata TaxID=1093978 RepID=A0AAV4FWD9_9GAST|nr:hypothetical protein ElyMa_002229100 [Elysia marginata]
MLLLHPRYNSFYFIIIIINMSGKIIIIIITTIIIIITNENLSVNTKKKTKIATASIKWWKSRNLNLWLSWTTFVKSLLFHMQRTVKRTAAVTVSAKQQYLGISDLSEL